MWTLLIRMCLVWQAKAGMFVCLMGLPIATILLGAITVNYAIAPHPPELPLREVWHGMGSLQKLAVFVIFLMTLGVQYRALAASAFATQEIWNTRSVHFWQAVKSVRRKQLRLFWLIFLASLVTGPLGLIVGPILLFATAPGFPVAILEGKSAVVAIKRGDTLMKHDHGKVAGLVILWLGAVIAAVFGWIKFLMLLEDQFRQPLPWFLKIVPSIGFWLILLISQLYMIGLTLLFLERRKREITGTVIVQAEAQV